MRDSELSRGALERPAPELCNGGPPDLWDVHHRYLFSTLACFVERQTASG